MKRARGTERGFTLIELLIVVAMIAILSGVLLPVFLRARDLARKRAAERVQAAPAAGAPTSTLTSTPTTTPLPRPTGAAPVIDSAALQLALATSYHRIGMDVSTRYRVDCTGRILFRHPSHAAADPMLLVIPFPDETLEARDVRLQLSRPGQKGTVSPTDVVYDRTGIYCLVAASPGQQLVADVAFTAFGRERFDYALPPARQLREVDIALRLSGAASRTIPDDALQPSSAEGDQLRWQLRNLVSDRQISVLIPGAQAPLARVLLLLRLMGIAVLLFGAGFWYLSEQGTPGRLDTFRWGHFLLLALTYSLFFVIFAVLEFHGTLGTPAAMGVAALFSLPLLILHVSRVLDMRFAVTRVVPLAVYTVGLVVIGVYAGDLRDYLFIGAAILTMAYLTLTYQSWAAGREAFRRERDDAYSTRRRELMERISTGFGARLAALSAADAEAALLLKAGSDAAGGALALHRARVQSAREPAARRLKEYEDLTRRMGNVPTRREWEASSTLDQLARDAADFQERLEPELQHLSRELEAYRAEVQTLAAPEDADRVHCMACGHTVPNTRFCPECGSEQPVRVACAGCGERITVPVHLLAGGRQERSFFCPRCGTPGTVPSAAGGVLVVKAPPEADD